MAGGDRAVDLLKLIRAGASSPGLRVVKVSTTDPNPITLCFEGTQLALDLDIFEVPISLYPLRTGDRFFSFPIVGNNRWGLLEKLNGGVAMGTMASSSSLRIDGINKTYGSSDLIIPPYISVGNTSSHYSDPDGTSDNYIKAGNIRPLTAGDRVSIAATWESSKIKYIILNRY